MIKEFIERVNAAETEGKRTLSFPLSTLAAVRDALAKMLEARAKGGRNRYKHADLKTDPDAVRNREAVRRHRAKKNPLRNP